MIDNVTIAGRVIGPGHPVFVIGEVGSCHDKNLSQAKKLIDGVAEAGADAVKFQLFIAEQLYIRSDPRFFELAKPFETPREWLPELVMYSKSRGILFSASPFDKEAVDLLVQVEAPFLKIASPEIRDFPLLEHCAHTGLPLIISTGATTLDDVKRAVNCVYKAGATDVVLLHCTSVYPTEPKDINLRVIETLRQTFNLPVGLSDHSMSSSIPAAAVAVGACLIEKHVTLDRLLRGPDHPISLTITEFKEMVKLVREIELALGSSVKCIIEGKERPDLHEKSIVARVDISNGEKITADKVTVKQVPGGIGPAFLNRIIAQTVRKKIRADTVLTWDMLLSDDR